MNSTAHFQFSRRSLMKAAGSTLLVPMFIKRAFAQTATRARPNLVMMMQTNGANQANFWPAPGTFDSPILNKLLTDTVVGPKTTVIKGINLSRLNPARGNGHDWGFHGIFSGYDNISSGSGHFGGGPSVDQALKKSLGTAGLYQPYPTLHTGVHAANYRLINAGRATFCCEDKGRQIPAELDIYKLYANVFSSVPGTTAPTTPNPAVTEAATRRLAQRKSVLDAVAQDLTLLRGRLGATERDKVDSHLTAVREFEKRLTNTMTGGGGPRPANCGTVKPFQAGVPTTGQGNEANADILTKLFMEFIANAIACDMVGILTFQLGRGGEHFHYGWLKIPGMRADFHDEIAHRDRNGDTVAGQVMTAVGKYHTELVHDLATRLSKFQQADGKTALDNSLVVWGNEVATGFHGIEGYPIVMVGGAAGKLKKTGYMVDMGPQPHHRLGCSIRNIMGDKVNGFGAAPACGQLQGLDVVA